MITLDGLHIAQSVNRSIFLITVVFQIQSYRVFIFRFLQIDRTLSLIFRLFFCHQYGFLLHFTYTVQHTIKRMLILILYFLYLRICVPYLMFCTHYKRCELRTIFVYYKHIHTYILILGLMPCSTQILIHYGPLNIVFKTTRLIPITSLNRFLLQQEK